jgi:hypothetical protein
MNELSFQPETIEDMKRRFPLAIAESILVSDIVSGKILPIIDDRSHVFDFSDGMRLIVSRDKLKKEEILHISATGDSDYLKTIKSEGIDGIIEDMILRISALRGKKAEAEPEIYLAPDGVIHILFRDI